MALHGYFVFTFFHFTHVMPQGTFIRLTSPQHLFSAEPNPLQGRVAGTKMKFAIHVQSVYVNFLNF